MRSTGSHRLSLYTYSIQVFPWVCQNNAKSMMFTSLARE